MTLRIAQKQNIATKIDHGNTCPSKKVWLKGFDCVFLDTFLYRYIVKVSWTLCHLNMSSHFRIAAPKWSVFSFASLLFNVESRRIRLDENYS